MNERHELSLEKDQSVIELLGEGHDVCFFGFNPLFFNVERAMKASKASFDFRTYMYCYFPFKEIYIPPSKPECKTSDGCKTQISSLIINNYEQRLMKKPITPFIFCIGYDLNIEKLAESSRKTKTASVVDSELRRCYKMVAEVESPIIREIAKETIRFAKVHEFPEKNSMTLEKIEPFWTNENWATLWSQRMAKRSNTTKKTSVWRKAMEDEITRLNKKYKK